MLIDSLSGMRAARSWLILAVSAMGLSTLLALLLVLSRTPGVQALFGLHDIFSSVLVLHVNFSVLVWLLAFSALLWRCGVSSSYRWVETVSLGMALLGALLMLASIFYGEAEAVLSNYIPVLDSRLFIAGLLTFAVAITIAALDALVARAAESELRMAALAWWVAVVIAAYHLLQLLPMGELHYEQLFWGAGHQLQFVYLLMLLFVWRQLSGVAAAHVARLALLPIVAALLLGIALDPQSDDSRRAFTHLMQLGTPLLLLPMVWKTAPAALRLGDTALSASIGLMVAGLAIGFMIDGDTVMVTAHYHATNAAITVAFMGYGFKLLEALGFAAPPARLCRWQTRLYAMGMTLYIAGMALSGWLGVPRKSAVVVDSLAAQLTMGLMGIGGIVSIIATLLFVGVMIWSFVNRSLLPLEKTVERPL